MAFLPCTQLGSNVVSKSVIWSSAVFTMFVGSAAYVGVSTAMTPPAPVEPEFASVDSVVVVAKPKPKATHAVHGSIKSAALTEHRT